MLHQIQFPDDSYYAMTYYTDQDADVLPGGISTLRVRHGGELRWTYKTLLINSQNPDPPGGPGEPSLALGTKAFGVATKETRLDPNDTNPLATWSYDYKPSGPIFGPGDTGVPCFRTTTITDPLGNDSIHYFATSYATERWTYGLGMTLCDPDTGAWNATGPHVSARIYEGLVDSGTLLRTVLVDYGSDGGSGGNGGDNQNKNHRLTYRKTVFHDDDDHYTEETFSDFDGLGNFRRRVEDGDFVAQAIRNERTTDTNFNPSSGTLIVNPSNGSTAGSTFVLPSTSDPWILGTWDKRGMEFRDETVVTEACFNAANGLTQTAALMGRHCRRGRPHQSRPVDRLHARTASRLCDRRRSLRR